MKAKEFTELKKQVKGNNLKGLKGNTIQDLTITQAKAMEDLLLDLELSADGNKLLDAIIDHIEGVVAIEKVANKKTPAPAPAPEAITPAPKTKAKEAKEAQKKEAQKKEPKELKPADTIQVGSVVAFQVEGEELQHGIKIIHIGRFNIIGIMTTDEREIFSIRKVDFNKGIFEWKDRHGESYNIIVSI